MFFGVKYRHIRPKGHKICRLASDNGVHLQLIQVPPACGRVARINSRRQVFLAFLVLWTWPVSCFPLPFTLKYAGAEPPRRQIDLALKLSAIHGDNRSATKQIFHIFSLEVFWALPSGI